MKLSTLLIFVTIHQCTALKLFLNPSIYQRSYPTQVKEDENLDMPTLRLNTDSFKYNTGIQHNEEQPLISPMAILAGIPERFANLKLSRESLRKLEEIRRLWNIILRGI